MIGSCWSRAEVLHPAAATFDRATGTSDGLVFQDCRKPTDCRERGRSDLAATSSFGDGRHQAEAELAIVHPSSVVDFLVPPPSRHSGPTRTVGHVV